MKKLIELKDLKVENQNNKILDGITLSIYEGVNTYICGTPSSGKTSLLKAIAGNVKYKGHILKNCKIEVVLDVCEFTKNTILEELDYDTLEKNQKKMISKFMTKTILKRNPKEVEEKWQKLLLICQALLREPNLIFVDSLFCFLDKKTLDKVYAYAKKNKITIVNVSTNIEESLDYAYMFVLDKGRIAIEGKALQVLEQEKLLKRLGIGLPFYVDLSIQLRLYGLIDKICLSKEELAGALWK